MTQEQLYQNIAKRTGGDIYLGVVGPVRTGKSSFIKRFAFDIFTICNNLFFNLFCFALNSS